MRNYKLFVGYGTRLAMESLPDITTLLNTITAFIASVGALIAGLTVISKTIRSWIVSKFTNKNELEATVKELKEELINIRKDVGEIKNQNISQNDSIKLIKDATLCEIRDTLTHMYYAAEKVGGLSNYNKENFEKMYQAYTNLGGNSYVHEIREKILSMKTLED